MMSKILLLFIVPASVAYMTVFLAVIVFCSWRGLKSRAKKKAATSS